MRGGGQAALLARGTRTIGMCSFAARSLGIQSGRPLLRPIVTVYLDRVVSRHLSSSYAHLCFLAILRGDPLIERKKMSQIRRKKFRGIFARL